MWGCMQSTFSMRHIAPKNPMEISSPLSKQIMKPALPHPSQIQL